MILRKDLIERFAEFGCSLYEVEFNEINNIIIFNDINQFIDFTRNNKAKNVFYNYIYLSPEMLGLTDEFFEENDVDRDLVESLKAKVNEYNMNLYSLDYSSPVTLEMMVYVDNASFYCRVDELWITEKSVYLPKQAWENIVIDNREEYLKNKELISQKNEQMLKKLEDIILNDDEFFKCTNSRLRRAYMVGLANKKETSWIIDEYKIETGYFDWLAFIEMLWKKHKGI